MFIFGVGYLILSYYFETSFRWHLLLWHFELVSLVHYDDSIRVILAYIFKNGKNKRIPTIVLSSICDKTTHAFSNGM